MLLKSIEKVQRQREQKRQWYKTNKQTCREQSKIWDQTHKESVHLFTVRHYARLRMIVLTHYGGNPPRCSCCHEDTLEFLGIHHERGDGATHRRLLKQQSIWIYKWLRNNNFPSGFGVLCHNCNLALGHYGYCPHKNQLSHEERLKLSLPKGF